MQPLNPLLAAFFRSPLQSQCLPVNHHILLVPTTEVLLTSRDRESGALLADLVNSEEFLGSHVLRIPSNAASAGGQDMPNMRENRTRAKQYTTINGRTVIIKDTHIYSNKGFKTLNQAQLLNDVLWYPDSLEPRSWLVYYISRPLIGVYEEAKTAVSLAPPLFNSQAVSRITVTETEIVASPNGLPQKKDVKSFNDLLNNFPMIARQMQPGLERLFREFSDVFEKPLPPPPSAANIPDPSPVTPIATAVKHARSNSTISIPSHPNGHVIGKVGDAFYMDDDEEVMRVALETAVTAAVDLFQTVDKQQLSFLGATTELTGPVVERLIERYVTEQVHDTILYPRLCSLKKTEDVELESNIRQMEFVDISQVGIPIQGGQRGKHELTLRVCRAVEEFRKMNNAESPQQMMDVLLLTLKTVTQFNDVVPDDLGQPSATSEKVSPVLTINADTLVSLLLIVVIRAKVRQLQARLLYMHHFIFIDDVEGGEMGYALSTFEAVISYLSKDSVGLRKASRRNKKLWQTIEKGDVHGIMKIMEPGKSSSPGDSDDNEHGDDPVKNAKPWQNRTEASRSLFSSSNDGELSHTATLNHVFPFQIRHEEPDEERFPPLRRPKMVTMDTSSMSSNSERSFRSRATTIDSLCSAIEGDTSIATLSQTQDSSGESVLMMAIQHKKPESSKYLLSLEKYFPLHVVLEDTNIEGTTLLSAAVQIGHAELIEIVLDFAFRAEMDSVIISYLERQDIRGRSVAHYLFNAPYLITRLGRLLPWRQKDRNGQTPLFALCRSYDHGNYRDMVEAALTAATAAQGDGQPLHLDEHVDAKGNTLLHIVNDSQIAQRILFHCDSNVNATNDKKFTPLMVASKYGRIEMVRSLFNDSRVDWNAKELRGLTAVELAKDDEIRNRIDDLVLFQRMPSPDGRVTAVVRSFFVEDATIRLVVKSGARTHPNSFTLTTCRRSLTDFEHLAKLLAIENPASWLPSITGNRSPFQIQSKPSRAVLRHIQVRLDAFLKILLSHTTFSTHEMLWEFLLVPDIRAEMMEQRSKLKVETRVEMIREEYEPVGDIADVERFVDHARDIVRNVNYATKSVIRRANNMHLVTSDLYDSSIIASQAFMALISPKPSYLLALELYFQSLSPTSNHPYNIFHSTFLSIHSTLIALLLSLSRPTSLISSIQQSNHALSRDYSALSRSTRWPLGLLDETRQRMDREKEGRIRKLEEERDNLGKELRYTQQVVANELAGWQEWRQKMVRDSVKELARSMVVVERVRLENMQRAFRKLRANPYNNPSPGFINGAGKSELDFLSSCK